MTEALKKTFEKHVAMHGVNIMQNNGVFRHLLCQRPNSSAYWFQITTWPEHLAISGDMGTYVFKRTRDMFGFFRSKDLSINPEYWAEKCTARCSGGVIEFSRDALVAAITETVNQAHHDMPDHVRRKIESIGDSESECAEWLREHDFEPFNTGERSTSDFYEPTHHYLWCCHAIVWAIAKFDEMTATQATEDAQ